MTTKDYQQKGMFSIFLSFFKPHRGLFFLDMVCALFVALAQVLGIGALVLILAEGGLTTRWHDVRRGKFLTSCGMTAEAIMTKLTRYFSMAPFRFSTPLTTGTPSSREPKPISL